jgi:hypothetical protein
MDQQMHSEFTQQKPVSTVTDTTIPVTAGLCGREAHPGPDAQPQKATRRTRPPSTLTDTRTRTRRQAFFTSPHVRPPGTLPSKD